ncbi:hypothetical protein KSP39_PZI014005 [Platanthera zijinensis]|uniref:Uncharacterized protein n=1 Tax=Platanthera zijinensis TaxID=2320716 RepID=A0AAP0BEC1_9ASPA
MPAHPLRSVSPALEELWRPTPLYRVEEDAFLENINPGDRRGDPSPRSIAGALCGRERSRSCFPLLFPQNVLSCAATRSRLAPSREWRLGRNQDGLGGFSNLRYGHREMGHVTDLSSRETLVRITEGVTLIPTNSTRWKGDRRGRRL